MTSHAYRAYLISNSVMGSRWRRWCGSRNGRLLWAAACVYAISAYVCWFTAWTRQAQGPWQTLQTIPAVLPRPPPPPANLNAMSGCTQRGGIEAAYPGSPSLRSANPTAAPDTELHSECWCTVAPRLQCYGALCQHPHPHPHPHPRPRPHTDRASDRPVHEGFSPAACPHCSCDIPHTYGDMLRGHTIREFLARMLPLRTERTAVPDVNVSSALDGYSDILVVFWSTPELRDRLLSTAPRRGYGVWNVPLAQGVPETVHPRLLDRSAAAAGPLHSWDDLNRARARSPLAVLELHENACRPHHPQMLTQAAVGAHVLLYLAPGDHPDGWYKCYEHLMDQWLLRPPRMNVFVLATAFPSPDHSGAGSTPPTLEAEFLYKEGTALGFEHTVDNEGWERFWMGRVKPVCGVGHPWHFRDTVLHGGTGALLYATTSQNAAVPSQSTRRPCAGGYTGTFGLCMSVPEDLQERFPVNGCPLPKVPADPKHALSHLRPILDLTTDDRRNTLIITLPSTSHSMLHATAPLLLAALANRSGGPSSLVELSENLKYAAGTDGGWNRGAWFDEQGYAVLEAANICPGRDGSLIDTEISDMSRWLQSALCSDTFHTAARAQTGRAPWGRRRRDTPVPIIPRSVALLQFVASFATNYSVVRQPWAAHITLANSEVDDSASGLALIDAYLAMLVRQVDAGKRTPGLSRDNNPTNIILVSAGGLTRGPYAQTLAGRTESRAGLLMASVPGAPSTASNSPRWPPAGCTIRAVDAIALAIKLAMVSRGQQQHALHQLVLDQMVCTDDSSGGLPTSAPASMLASDHPPRDTYRCQPLPALPSGRAFAADRIPVEHNCSAPRRYGNFDIILVHLPGVCQPSTTPPVPCAVLYVVPMLVGC